MDIEGIQPPTADLKSPVFSPASRWIGA